MTTTRETMRLLSALDAATVNPRRAPDARRVLRDEACSLRAAQQSGDRARIEAARTKAARVLDMWDGF